MIPLPFTFDRQLLAFILKHVVALPRKTIKKGPSTLPHREKTEVEGRQGRFQHLGANLENFPFQISVNES